MNAPDEPILLSAPLARQVAAKLCRRDSVTGEDCAWYHGLWQDLRLLGLVATPALHADFFLTAVKHLALRQRLIRLLVSGAADYAIVAHLLWAGDAHGVELEITVIDSCETPLFLNRWYAERSGRRLRTIHADLFQYTTPSPYDVICSHGFLSQFNPLQRAALVAKWSTLLPDGGTLMLINRIRSQASQQPFSFSAEQAAEFCAVIDRRIKELPGDTRDVPARARAYVQRLRGYALTADELAALLKQNGFRLTTLSTTTSAKSDTHQVSGPAVPTNAQHACALAVKERSAA
jgi:hypothetical protein